MHKGARSARPRRQALPLRRRAKRRPRSQAPRRLLRPRWRHRRAAHSPIVMLPSARCAQSGRRSCRRGEDALLFPFFSFFSFFLSFLSFFSFFSFFVIVIVSTASTAAR